MNYIIIIFIIVCAAITSLVMLLRLLQITFLFARRIKPAEIKIVEDEKLPKITIMIPAYNEEKVIGKTLKTIVDLEYPDEKFEVLIINPLSQDNTAQIAQEIAFKSKRNFKVIDATDDFEHHGKPRALNFGLKHATGEIIIIYDADSLVDRMAAKYLVSYLVTHPQVAMAFGMRKAVNPHSFFARLAYLESLSQQLLTEAAPPKEGQKFLFSPGTNVAIRKSILEELGGWDDSALTEDFEISIRLHSHGYKIEYVHSALSYEEVPEKLSTWIAQRSRWARGGNQVFFKALKETRKGLEERKFRFINFIVLLKIIEFYSPLLALFFGDVLLVLGIIEIAGGGIGIGFSLWLLLYILLSLQILACLIYMREINLKNILGSFLLYFYFQVWLVVFARVIWLDLIRAPNIWEKTERFA